MRKLSQLQYEVIFLYSKGLTFKEIDTALTTASKGVYNQVVAKDKGRITRAKKSREINLNSYKIELINKLDEFHSQYKVTKKFCNWTSKEYTFYKKAIEVEFREKYINDSLDKANKSYSKYKITFLKNYLEKVA